MELIGDLAQAGVRKVHMLSHSAGCKLAVGVSEVFGRCFKAVLDADVHNDPLDSQEESRARKVELCTFTLLNADVSRH